MALKYLSYSNDAKKEGCMSTNEKIFKISFKTNFQIYFFIPIYAKAVDPTWSKKL